MGLKPVWVGFFDGRKHASELQLAMICTGIDARPIPCVNFTHLA
jgi:hypothetical protein